MPAHDNREMLDATYHAVRSSTELPGVYHSRDQLYVFSAEEELDTAISYVEGLARELSHPARVTQVTFPCSRDYMQNAW